MKKYNVKMGQIDFVLFATIMLLVAIGVVMVYSASSYYAAFKFNDPEYFLKKQFLWAIIGSVFMVTAIKIDYHIIKRYTGFIMVITIILLLAVFAFPAINGAKRWIQLGFASFQPSEIAKYTVVLYMAKSLEQKGERVKEFLKGVCPYLLVSGFLCMFNFAWEKFKYCSGYNDRYYDYFICSRSKVLTHICYRFLASCSSWCSNNS